MPRSCFASERLTSSMGELPFLHLLFRRSDSDGTQSPPFGVQFRVFVLVPGAGECVLQAAGVKYGLCVAVCGRVSMVLYSMTHKLS